MEEFFKQIGSYISEYGFKLLLAICIVIAGINDAAANLGKKQYIHHIKLITDFLLANNIRPVLIEIPDVNIWKIYGEKPIKDMMVDFIKSKMTRCGMYQYSEYRQALQLLSKEYNDSVLYVLMNAFFLTIKFILISVGI